jgi:arylsulfatase A-like enzyme
MPVTRRAFLGSAAAAALTFAQSRRKPNVVYIVSDDHGYGEIASQGSDIPTPNIDSLGANGVRFTNGYVSCPVCSPTRAGLMTGRYQQRFGHEFNPGPPQAADADFGLPLTETTVANYMKDLGYRTGIVGKWHLGYKPEYHPFKRGFEEFFGFTGGGHSYVNARADSRNPILRGTEPVNEKEYLTDAFAREAVAFIDRHRSEPFFLYLAFNAVHTPMEAPDKYTSRFPNITDPRRRTFAGMLTALDEAVGRVLTKLREHGIEENTLIVFHGDNGGPTPVNTASNSPLRGTKGTIWEGGIRVPFLMQWKARLPRGKVYDQPVIALDILPTAVVAAGGKVPPAVEGVDLLPALTSNAGAPHEALYWRFGAQRAIRKGDWKLVDPGRGWELYNLRTDIGEAKNLAASEPQRVNEMIAAYDAWNARNVEPKWARRRASARNRRERRQRRRRRSA